MKYLKIFWLNISKEKRDWITRAFALGGAFLTGYLLRAFLDPLIK